MKVWIFKDDMGIYTVFDTEAEARKLCNDFLKREYDYYLAYEQEDISWEDYKAYLDIALYAAEKLEL